MRFALRNRLSAVLALAIATTFVPIAGTLSSAVPLTPSPASFVPEEPFVTISKDVAVSVEGTFTAGVRVRIDRPTSYLESRLQIHSDSGDLIFQKTEVRNDVTTGTVTIGYERALSDLGLDPGAHPLTIRVRSDSGGEVRQWDVEDELLVYDPRLDPVPLVLVARITSAPLLDPQGRFVMNPSHAPYARQQVEQLAALVMARPGLRLSLALPPILAEEWLRASQGYDYVDEGGASSAGADSEYAQACRGTLAALREAIATGRLELLDIPYADPDIEGLVTIGHVDDLAAHYEQGLSAYLAALETSPSATTLLAGNALPAGAVDIMQNRDLVVALMAETSLEETGQPQTVGTIGGGLAGMLIDSRATEALQSGESTTFARAVFDHHASEEPTMPVVAVVDIGSGSPCNVAHLESCAARMFGAPWVRPVLAAEAAEAASSDTSLPPFSLKAEADSGSDAPRDYWPAVQTARAGAEALLAAFPATDPEARAAVTASLVAESRMWAGFDGAWSLADRGRAHAAAAQRAADAALAGVTVAASDITLSGPRGSVPVQVANPGDKTMALTLRVYPERLNLIGQIADSIALRPGDNFLELPVDLGSSLAGTVRVEVWAGQLLLDEATVTVRASYLDRLAIVGGITIILAGMLWFIRKRARGAEVGIIADRAQRRSDPHTVGGSD